MKNLRIVTAMLIALVILFSMFVPTMKVFAFAETNKITISFRSGYTSEQGKVQYSVNDGANWIDVTSDITDQSITMAGDNLKIKIVPAEGYDVDFAGIELYEDSTKIEGTGALTNANGYQVTAAAKSVSLIYVEFRTASGGDPIDPPPSSNEEVASMKFRLNGQDISADFSQEEPQVQVNSNMNFDKLEEFYITEIVTDKKTYTYAANQYGLNLKDNEDRTILETNLTKQTSNLAYLRVQTHVEDIKESDLTAIGKAREDFCGFYITQLKLIKPEVKGTVGVKAAKYMPDVYDFVSFNGIELGDTSINNFGKVTTYYGDDTIDLSGEGCNITNIELVEGKGVSKSAVDIDVTNKKVKVKSNYFNEIPLKITAKIGEDNVVGYINISRVGIYIDTLNKGSKEFYHGATNGNVKNNGGNLNVDTDKNRIVAVFYHDNTESINDYDIIVNIVNKDGTTETKLAKPVGDVNDNAGPLVGSDFILWEGDSVEEQPSKISATAVKKGATSNKTTFGGATLGAGAGVTWVNAK